MQRPTNEHTRSVQPFVINNPLTVASESPVDLRQHYSIFKSPLCWEGQIQLHEQIGNDSSVCQEQGRNLSLLEAFSFIQDTHQCDLRSEREGDQHLFLVMHFGALGAPSVVQISIISWQPQGWMKYMRQLWRLCDFHPHREALAGPKCIPVLSWTCRNVAIKAHTSQCTKQMGLPQSLSLIPADLELHFACTKLMRRVRE